MILRKTKTTAKWESLTIPFAPGVAIDMAEADNLLDLGELPENSFRGMASVFGEVIDAFMPTVMQRGAFTKTLAERARNIPILWQHDIDDPIGKPVHLFENEAGLVLEAKISRVPSGLKALTLLRDGVISALSIGFDPVVFDFVEQEDKSMKRFIREARLHEISVVTLGADANAQITEVRAGQVAGVLRSYWQGEDFGVADDENEPVADSTESLSGEGTLAERFAAFVAETDVEGDVPIVEAFALTLHEAGPEDTPPTLSDVEFQLMEADLLAAELDLETL